MMPINESSIGLLADEAAKAIYKTKRMPKYKKKRDRIVIKATFKARRPGVETVYIEKKNWKGIVGSRGDGI